MTNQRDLDGYEKYGDRMDEIQHGMRELLQLQLGLTSGALTQSEYTSACRRIRSRYGIEGWGETNTGP